MRRKYIFIPLIAVIVGVCGCILRQRQLATGFDMHGLPIPGNPWALALVLLSAAMAVLLAVLVARLKPRDHPGVVALHLSGPAYPAVTIFASLLLLVGALGSVISARGVEHDILKVEVLALFAVAAAVCTAVFSLSFSRKNDLKNIGIPAVIPIFFLCFWLIIAYRDQSANPITLSFIYQILAIICGLLGFYYAASMVFPKPKPRRAIYFSLLCIYFSLVCVEESSLIPDYLYFVFINIYLLVWSISLLRNAIQ